jgi:hypothetical protein
MNRALLYLWLVLLKRRVLAFGRGLRRPTNFIGVAAVLGLLGLLFWFRHEKFFGQLLQPNNLAGGALLMLGASLFQGFSQRGLAFEPPDLEFVFTSPFTERQVLGYRLLPHYLYALVQGIVFAALFAPHLKHPSFVAAAMVLFQITCFHLATGAAVFAGTLPEELHQRLRWMLLGGFAFLAAVFFRLAWDIQFVPQALAGPLAQMLFYPAVTLPDAVASPALHRWALRLASGALGGSTELVKPALGLSGFALGAALSLWGLLRLKGNLFGAALATTTRRAERRLQARQGRDLAAAAQREARSARMPKLPLFGGVGALVWKNLLVARRSRRELGIALLFVTLCTWGIGALTHQVYGQTGGEPDPHALMAARAFNFAVALFLALFAFILQRVFPFDFRRDGHHLEAFRALPASPLALVIAEMAVPVLLVLGCQAVGLLPLVLFGRVEGVLLLLILFGYPAIALALSAVWNLHYLLAARRRAGGEAQTGTAVGTLMVVALSFLVFVPASWALHYLAPKTGVAQVAEDTLPETLLFGNSLHGLPLAAGGALSVQYLVDLLLLLLLARLFGRFEAARESS